jgi:hypothetical protein
MEAAALASLYCLYTLPGYTCRTYTCSGITTQLQAYRHAACMCQGVHDGFEVTQLSATPSMITCVRLPCVIQVSLCTYTYTHTHGMLVTSMGVGRLRQHSTGSCWRLHASSISIQNFQVVDHVNKVVMVVIF